MAIKQSLAERYTPDFIAQAEVRRSRLDYKSLHVGSGSHVRIERVKTLLYQTHQNYYFGNFSASCILCGILFEQSLICLLEEEIGLQGKITFKQGAGVIAITEPCELVNLSLLVLINTAVHYQIIPREYFSLATELRLIRNHLMHDDLGIFIKSGANYEFNLGIMVNGAFVCTPITLPIIEVDKHCLTRDSDEIWAYYLLTRTRHIIEHMFAERVKRLPPEKISS